MDLNVIKRVIALLEESNLKKIHLKDGDFEIALEKGQFKKAHLKNKEDVELENAEIEKKESSGNFVESPMVGTFYIANSPDQPSFVKVGDAVEEDTVVCIIEAMKVMNEIKAGKKGVIKEILIKNGRPVEFGTKLFELE